MKHAASGSRDEDPFAAEDITDHLTVTVQRQGPLFTASIATRRATGYSWVWARQPDQSMKRVLYPFKYELLAHVIADLEVTDRPTTPVVLSSTALLLDEILDGYNKMSWVLPSLAGGAKRWR